MDSDQFFDKNDIKQRKILKVLRASLEKILIALLQSYLKFLPPLPSQKRYTLESVIGVFSL